MLAALRDRLYADFLMPSRLGEYRALLEGALRDGYEVLSVEAMWRLASGPGLDPGRRYLVLRHDVDTDPRTARAMWKIDRQLGIRPSFYFRLSTVDVPLMRSIAAAGGEASYHYEELATVAKRHGLTSRAEVEDHLPEARAELARNLTSLRARTRLPMPVISAHGDFVNRRVGVPNWAIVGEELRARAGIEAEAYDAPIIGRMTSQYTDVPHPRYWSPGDPAAALAAGDHVVFVLVHPRHWRIDRRVNARDDLQRAIEGLRFEVALRRKGRA